MNKDIAGTIRPAQQSDIQALQNIWKKSFGDSDEEIEDFFSYYFEPRLTIVADSGTGAVAAGYILPFGNLIYGRLCVPCAMIYAVAALPEYRNRSFGTYVVRDLITKGHQAGFGAIVLSPSSDSLFEYYSSRTDMTDCFYVNEKYFETVPDSGNAVTLSKIAADEYVQVREQLLLNIPHIAFDMRAASYQSLLCRQSGGAIYRAWTPEGVGCAVVEDQSDGNIAIKELLTSRINEADVLSAIASIHPASGYIVRKPVSSAFAESGSRRFGMLAASSGIISASIRKSASPYYGLAFD